MCWRCWEKKRTSVCGTASKTNNWETKKVISKVCHLNLHCLLFSLSLCFFFCPNWTFMNSDSFCAQVAASCWLRTAFFPSTSVVHNCRATNSISYLEPSRHWDLYILTAPAELNGYFQISSGTHLIWASLQRLRCSCKRLSWRQERLNPDVRPKSKKERSKFSFAMVKRKISWSKKSVKQKKAGKLVQKGVKRRGKSGDGQAEGSCRQSRWLESKRAEA